MSWLFGFVSRRTITEPCHDGKEYPQLKILYSIGSPPENKNWNCHTHTHQSHVGKPALDKWTTHFSISVLQSCAPRWEKLTFHITQTTNTKMESDEGLLCLTHQSWHLSIWLDDEDDDDDSEDVWTKEYKYVHGGAFQIVYSLDLNPVSCCSVRKFELIFFSLGWFFSS